MPRWIRRAVLEGLVVSCDPAHNLIVELPCGRAVIPRTECALGIAEGTTREIAILSACQPTVAVHARGKSADRIVLSRRAAQAQMLDWAIQTQRPGDVIRAQASHLEPFGVFVDIGCGVTSFIGIEHLSVSRIFHPSERFSVGQPLYAAVLGVDPERGRVALTHRELLGTWEENAALFHARRQCQAGMRSLESYQDLR